MEFTAQQIAELIGGKLEGDPDVTVSRLIKIDENETGGLGFLANPKYESFIYTTGADVVIVPEDFKAGKELKLTLIRVDEPYLAIASLLEVYNKMKLDKSGISDLAFVDATATIGKDVYIGEYAFIGKDVVLGDGVKIYPNTYVGDFSKISAGCLIFSGARLYHDTVMGSKCTIHSGVIIGGDGFGFTPNEKGEYVKVAQTGNVLIEDNVEIGANTTIDRATIGSTIIRKGVKLDNLIQVAHNVEIGENTVIAAQTGISGSTKIGKNCMIGGQVGIAGHLRIGDNVKIQAQSGIPSNVGDGEIIMGSPAINLRQFMKSYIHFKNLGDIAQRLDDLEKKINKD
ncbi:MAG: UDP-3-O-(3-hydroxymyristoyl)glucosamine N-acyltransferase [Bacteroidales bacterium]|nr:UDP-3-O-(3-hydroxymyristoyl)glucosamine N-acyltransferase [Bacteroidales bacterium]